MALCGAPAAAALTPTPDRDVPDLALIVANHTGRTRTLRSGQPGFDGLWQLLQPMRTETERVADAWEEGRYPSVRITVVWGLTGVGGWPQTHRAPGADVAMEREDQLFLAADGTPWVRSDLSPDVEDDDIRWHRLSRRVYDQVDRTGLLGAAGDGPDAGPSGAADWPERAGWAVAGLAAGVGGTLLTRRAAARREAGPPREEPRQELIDL
ncbi:hypothetical protein [Streptomyces sp. NPDC002265]|uniref:hypothetical protein n=1 Tax=Streptomyces sp. NPDC002265 TaxID=3154415 RepID=UPI0033296363